MKTVLNRVKMRVSSSLDQALVAVISLSGLVVLSHHLAGVSRIQTQRIKA